MKQMFDTFEEYMDFVLINRNYAPVPVAIGNTIFDEVEVTRSPLLRRTEFHLRSTESNERLLGIITDDELIKNLH